MTTKSGNPFDREFDTVAPLEILRRMEEDLEEFDDEVLEAEQTERKEAEAIARVKQRRTTITDHMRESHFGNFPARHPDIDQQNEDKLADIVSYLIDEKGVETPDEASTMYRNLVQQARHKQLAQNHPELDQVWAVIQTGQVV